MKRQLNKILWIITIIAIIVAIAAVYVTSQREQLLKEQLNTVLKVKDAVNSINLAKPKNGKDASMEQINKSVANYIAKNPPANGAEGKNVTDEQLNEAVERYFKQHPIRASKDGKTPIKGKDYEDGKNGVTPQLRCNVAANRWEVRYSIEDNWQLLNGEKVKCTTEVQP